MNYVDVRVRDVRVSDKSGADMVLPMHENRHYGHGNQNESLRCMKTK